MQTVSNLYKELLASDYWVETRLAIDVRSRLINEEGYFITFGGYRILVADRADPDGAYGPGELISMSTSGRTFSNNTPTVGCCMAAQLNVEMIMDSNAIPKNAKLVPYVRLTDGTRHSEWIQKGVFYIDTRKERDTGSGRKRLIIHAYDAMLKAEQDCPMDDHSWPATDISVAREICSYLGFELDPRTEAAMTKRYQVQMPVGYSCREVLGYIAAMYGGNFVMSDQGKLLLVQMGTQPADTVDIGRRMRNFTSSEARLGYDRVELVVNEDSAYYAGADSGRTLTVECPFGTQDIANALLAQFRDFRYQPYKAENAILNPTAELGDGITANGVTGVIYTTEATFGTGFRCTASAPWEEELDHEYPYVPKKDRKIRRQLHGLTTELTVQAGLIQGEIIDRINEIDVMESRITQNAESISAEVTARQNAVTSLQSSINQTATQISAKVSKTGGDPSSFEWNLTDSSWKLKSKGSTVLNATASGVEITGKITATSGEIGGFTIEDGYLSTRDQTWGGDSYYGIYIGPYGIQLGTDFSVSRTGHLEAASGKFTGEVYAGSISYDGEAGTFSGWGLEQFTVGGWMGNDRIDTETLTTNNFVEGVNESLANADWAAGVLSGAEAFESMSALYAYVESLDVSDYLYFGGRQLYLGSFPDRNGTIQRCVQWYDN